jgi:hypothetical protein
VPKQDKPRSPRVSSRADQVDIRAVERTVKALQDQERPGVDTAALALRAELSALQRSAVERLEPLVAKGVDVTAVKKVLADYEKERTRFLKGKMPEIERAMSTGEQRSEAAAARRQALEVLAIPGLPFTPTTFTLKPFLIWATNPSGMLVDSHADPTGYSWAKVSLSMDKLPSGSNGYASSKLVFYHLWTNPSDHYAVVNAKCKAWFNGIASVTANTSLLGGTVTSLSCTASIQPLEWWNQPPTYQPPHGWEHYSSAFSITAVGGGVWSLETGDLEVATLPGLIREMRWDLFSIPPAATAVFEVTILFSHQLYDDHGHIAIDFASRPDYSIASLFQLELLTAPSVGSPIIGPGVFHPGEG